MASASARTPSQSGAGGGDLVALLIGERVVVDAQHVEFDAAGDQGDLRSHVQRDLRGVVQCDAHPREVGPLLGDAVLEEETAGLVGAVDLEALVVAAVLLGQAEVVEQGADVEQLGVEVELVLLPAQRAEHVHAAAVVVDDVGCGFADELGRLLGQLAVGDCDSGDFLGHDVPSHVRLCGRATEGPCRRRWFTVPFHRRFPGYAGAMSQPP